MTHYPGAVYRPLNSHSYPGDMSSDPLGLVLHVNDGSDGPGGASLYSFISGGGGGKSMSCHWQIANTGVIEEYVDTENASWCQTAGNRTYFSVETQGKPGEPMTDEQVAALAGLVAWLFPKYGIPFSVADHVGDRGLAWHGMGGDAWGGHPGCPGDLRKAQRSHVLALAHSIAYPPKPAPIDALEAILSTTGAPATYAEVLSDITGLIREQLVEFNFLPGDDAKDRDTHQNYSVVGRAVADQTDDIAAAVKAALAPSLASIVSSVKSYGAAEVSADAKSTADINAAVKSLIAAQVPAIAAAVKAALATPATVTPVAGTVTVMPTMHAVSDKG